LTTTPRPGGGKRERVVRVLAALCLPLLAVVAFEAFLLHRQAGRDALALGRSHAPAASFTEADTARAPLGPGVVVGLRNVRFTWSDKIYVDAGDVALRARPFAGSTVDFDDPASFSLYIQQSVVLIRPAVLAGMFNENIFGYPGSRVRNLKVTVVRNDQGVWAVKLDGTLDVIARVPFTMYTRLSVDPVANTLVIEVDHLTVFGFLPATKFIRWTPMNLARLIDLPANPSVAIRGNRILVKPLGLFPPPRIDGRMSAIEVDDGAIRITFAGDQVTPPGSTAKNFVFLRGGASHFGHFTMTDTNVLIVDQDPSNPFVFSLLHYGALIPRSTVTLPDLQSARIVMPDF
jgi:hypothetical protein